MTGFKNFLLRGNLIELAVAFIMAAAFAAGCCALHGWEQEFHQCSMAKVVGSELKLMAIGGQA